MDSAENTRSNKTPRLAVVSTIFVKGNDRALSLECNGLSLRMIIESQTI